MKPSLGLQLLFLKLHSENGNLTSLRTSAGSKKLSSTHVFYNPAAFLSSCFALWLLCGLSNERGICIKNQKQTFMRLFLWGWECYDAFVDRWKVCREGRSTEVRHMQALKSPVANPLCFDPYSAHIMHLSTVKYQYILFSSSPLISTVIWGDSS